MPFSTVFNVSSSCAEHNCKINKKNIKTIYKPDYGFINKSIETILFPTGKYKICDCIIVCDNNDLIIVEILCGKLTSTELKEKKEQLENCCKVTQHLSVFNKVKKIVLLYKKLESPRKQPMLKKALISSRVCSMPLITSTNKPFHVEC